MVARTQKADMEAALVGMEAARPPAAGCDLPLLLRWWRGVAPVGDGGVAPVRDGWEWASMGVGWGWGVRLHLGVRLDIIILFLRELFNLPTTGCRYF
ncbi:hypothetical protein H5410_032489 [Solanum commersonii]|uniref:Uncharacterized protein n=1 Tax=Solanum commersonii TaxID=4109 RepID=A0A9J5YN08_SOLCO|nr:hypothetical protein H5410_032489 [Solanum commersonii]